METTDPLIGLADPRAISILNAEHASLVASRNLAYNEGFVRTGMFLTAVSAALVALGFVAQALAFGDGFQVFAILVLGLVLVLGVTTLIRVAETSREDLRAVQGMNRIRHAYFEICPELVPYFSTSDRDDLMGVTAGYEGPPPESGMAGPASIVHGFGTAVGMVGLLVSLIGGALAGVVAGALGLSFVLASLIGALAFVGLLVVITALIVRSVLRFGEGLDARFPSDPLSVEAPAPDEPAR